MRPGIALTLGLFAALYAVLCAWLGGLTSVSHVPVDDRTSRLCAILSKTSQSRSAEEFIREHGRAGVDGSKRGATPTPQLGISWATTAETWAAVPRFNVSEVHMRFQADATPKAPHTRALDPDHLARTLDLPLCFARKWMVVTTVSPHPTKVMHQFGRRAGQDWCVVVVADLSTPESLHAHFSSQYPQVIYLSPEKQRRLPYTSARDGITSWNHIARKNLGYLYAVHQGAEEIYDTDDDNELIDESHIISFDVDERQTTLKAPSGMSLVYNPYPEFGVRPVTNADVTANSPATSVSAHVWPRGFPLRAISNLHSQWMPGRPIKDSHESCVIRDGLPTPSNTAKVSPDSISVIQALISGDPDVDAIYRLTRNGKLAFSAARTKTVVLPPGLFSPFNSQATLWRKNAFHSLLLPSFVHGRVTDIWRSYIAQRIFWDLGLLFAISGPSVYQLRNYHDNLGDFIAEQQLYEQTEELLRVLTTDVVLDEIHGSGSASVKSGSRIPAQLERIYARLYQLGFVTKHDFVQAQAWIEDLIRLGYDFPHPAPQEPPTAGLKQFRYSDQLHTRTHYKFFQLMEARNQGSWQPGQAWIAHHFGDSVGTKIYPGSPLWKAISLGAQPNELSFESTVRKIAVFVELNSSREDLSCGRVSSHYQALSDWIAAWLHPLHFSLEVWVSSETVNFGSQPGSILDDSEHRAVRSFPYSHFIALEFSEVPKQSDLNPKCLPRVDFRQLHFGTLDNPVVWRLATTGCQVVSSVIGPIEVAEAYLTRQSFRSILSERLPKHCSDDDVFAFLTRGVIASTTELDAC